VPPRYKLIQERRSFLLDHGRERTFEIAIRICAQDDKLHAETRCPTICPLSVKSRHRALKFRCPLYPKSGHWEAPLRCPLCAKSCREQVQQKSATERQVPSLTASPTTHCVA
jgi:hypothetical protein